MFKGYRGPQSILKHGNIYVKYIRHVENITVSYWAPVKLTKHKIGLYAKHGGNTKTNSRPEMASDIY